MANLLVDLPQDLLAVICSWLDFRDIRALCKTCKTLQSLSCDADGDFWEAIVRVRIARTKHRPPLHLSRCAHVELFDFAHAVWCVRYLPQKSLVPPCSAPPTVANGPNGRIAVAASGHLRMWRGGDWAGPFADTAYIASSCARCISSLAFDSNGGLIAAGSADKTIIVYNVHDDKLIPRRPLRGHSRPVSSLAFMRGAGEPRETTEKLLASGSEDTTIRLHDIESRRSLQVLRGHGGTVSWVESTKDGGNLLSCSYAEGRLKLWDVENAVCVTTLKIGDAIKDLAVDQMWGDTVYVACSSTVRVIDLRASASTAAILSMPRNWRNAGPLRTLTLRHDGLLAGGVGGGAVAVWDATGPWEARGLGWPGRGGHRESRAVKAVALSSRTAILGCADGRVSSLCLDDDISYDEIVAVASHSRVGVTAIATDSNRENILAIARSDGSLTSYDIFDDDVVIDWQKAETEYGDRWNDSRGLLRFQRPTAVS